MLNGRQSRRGPDIARGPATIFVLTHPVEILSRRTGTPDMHTPSFDNGHIAIEGYRTPVGFRVIPPIARAGLLEPQTMMLWPYQSKSWRSHAPTAKPMPKDRNERAGGWRCTNTTSG